MRTSPTENSTAEKIKKKNVSERRCKLSYITPTSKVNAYKVIHISSAVNSRCKAVFTCVVSVVISTKIRITARFVSPKNKVIVAILYLHVSTLNTDLLQRSDLLR